MDRYGFETIATELDDGVLKVTYNRPEQRNAINAVMHKELRALYARIDADDEVDVVVITGAGKAFCVGGDFAQMQANFDAGGYADGHPALFGDAAALARNILGVRQPMIAMVNGHALGLGASLALFCDIVYIASTAKIGDPHVNAGLVAGDGGVVLWPLLLGINRAKEYLMTGDLLDAAEAERIGLVNHVVAPDDLEATVMAAARRLAEGPAIAIRFNKRLVNKELEDRVSRIYDMALAMEAITFESADHKGAVEAFLAKRTPVFAKFRTGG